MKPLNIFLSFLLMACPAFGAAYTSSGNGNWSNAATWGGSGPPGDGDTASIGHTITVDVDTIIGSSPNDTTTAVITLTAARVLTVGAGVTLTVKGNVSWDVNGAGLALSAGANVIFDNSASGGTPVYTFISNTYNNLACNGTAGSPCSMSAIAGQYFSLNQSNLTPMTCSYTTFTRLANTRLNNPVNSHTFTNCTFNGCGQIETYSTVDNTSTIFIDCVTTNTIVQANLGSIKLSNTSGNASGVRKFDRNLCDRFVNYNTRDFLVRSNFFYGGIDGIPAADHQFADFSHNVVRHDGSVEGNGLKFSDSVNRNYFIGETGGNPHFINPTSLQGHDTVLSQNIFESYSPDAIDFGDCIMITGIASSGGYAVFGKNNIVLADSYAGTSCGSGTLTTLFTATTAVTKWHRNTCDVQLGAVATFAGALNFAEGSGGVADQITEAKSNIAWSTAAGNQVFAIRQSGNVKDIITASGSDYNWTYNTIAGDNQRGYEDGAAANTLWTAGDAVAAGVDSHQGSGNPQFYDSARNLAKWCYDRGYGTQTYTNAITVLQNDLGKIPDLITYVFEGFRPVNPTLRNAAHDGGCVGAANFCRERNPTPVANHRATLSLFGL